MRLQIRFKTRGVSEGVKKFQGVPVGFKGLRGFQEGFKVAFEGDLIRLRRVSEGFPGDR